MICEIIIVPSRGIFFILCLYSYTMRLSSMESNKELLKN